MKKLWTASAALLVLACTSCFNHMKAGRVAGSWKVNKIVIHRYDSTGAEISDTTFIDPGFMILEFQDEDEKTGDFELTMDSTTMVPCKTYNKINGYSLWHRFDDLEFGYMQNGDFIQKMALKVKRLGRVEMDLEYREIWGAGAGADHYKEEWFLVRGN